MTKQITPNWYLQFIKGIIMILLAILVFASPAGALLTWAVYIGIGMLLAGIAIIVMGYSSRRVMENWGWRVFEGLIDVSLGFMLIANPAITAEVFPFVIGFWGLLYGFLLFADSFAATKDFGLKMISAIIIVLISTTLLFDPLFAGLTLTFWFGILLLVAGIYNVIYSFSLK